MSADASVPSRSRPRWTRRVGWSAAAAAFLALLAWFHWPALNLYFSQDDFPLLASSHPGWQSPWSFFLMGSPREYRPLTQHFYFYLNQLLFGLHPLGHHLMNLLVHAANSLLAGWLAWRWVGRWAFVPALFLFAFHPVHFYEVFWVSGISQAGYVFFLLGTLAALLRYRETGCRWCYGLAVLCAAAAFLSKEDAVMLPAIASAAFLLPRPPAGGWRRTAWRLLPFWLLLPAYFALRFAVLDFGLPQGGVYDFGLDVGRIWHKMISYGRSLLINEWVGLVAAAVLVLAGWTYLRRRARECQADFLRLSLGIPAMAGLSLVPTFLVESTADHYLSFASAALAWGTLLMLARIGPSSLTALDETRTAGESSPHRRGGRREGNVRESAGSLPLRGMATAALIGLVFLSAVYRRDAALANESLWVPIPRKAALCEKWAAQFRREGPVEWGCAVLLRDVPLPSAWESAWMMSLPQIAWDLPVPDVTVQIQGQPLPDLSDRSCLDVWTFADGNAVPVPR